MNKTIEKTSKFSNPKLFDQIAEITLVAAILCMGLMYFLQILSYPREPKQDAIASYIIEYEQEANLQKSMQHLENFTND